MGHLRVKTKVANPAEPTRFTELTLLVDTGATFTVVSRDTLSELGVKADTKFRLRTAEGRFIERDGGTAHVEVEGRGYKVPVVFGDEKDVEVLGATTLEILGLQVDPIDGKLKPSGYLLLNICARQALSLNTGLFSIKV